MLANLRRSGEPYQLTQRQLMDALRLTSGTVSVRVDRLAERGLVRREHAPDARGVLVTLTEEGARKFDTLAPRHLVNESRLVAALNPDQQAILAALLHSLLLEYEPATPGRPDERLGLVVAPAHVGLERRAAVGLPPSTGLLLETVYPGGPADAAGLRAGDLLLRTPERELRSLACLARAIEGKRTLTVDIRRGGSEITTTVALPDP